MYYAACASCFESVRTHVERAADVMWSWALSIGMTEPAIQAWADLTCGVLC